MGGKKPNFTPFGNKKSGKKPSLLGQVFKPAKKQTSRKVHDSKGKPGHGQGKKF